ncbi:hypothetical protein [Actinoplanes lobatus]|uniref:Uncharacterized protein n=1 Tax=Actinoplanes lobatus TaxID=113568 RepID=A0A7W7HGH0_9ACTN|nr:hypothetical protein [Actinoplanes lobatus]MBB4750114.1 hypothetical protein [Actinoplanes lobatus]
MGFTINWRYGTGTGYDDRVPDEALTELLAELDEDDVEHGDVWLSDGSSGWSLGVFAGDSHLVVLENDEQGRGPFHRTGVTRAESFTLLRRLADGHAEQIAAEPWSPGYGG